VTWNGSAPRPIAGDEVNAFGAWCRVADAKLAE
jgi:hypothetical protein